MLNRLPASGQCLARFVPFLFLSLFSGSFFQLKSQTPGVICSLVRVGQSNGVPGDTVWLDVRINAPDSIAAMQFAVSWDPTQLHYAQLRFTGSDLPYIYPGDFNEIQPGRLLFAWYDLGASGVPLPAQDALLFQVGLVLQAGVPDFCPVSVGSVPGLEYEIAATPFPYNPLYENCGYGGVYNSAAPVNSPVFTQLCTNTAGCSAAGKTGIADISVNGGAPPYQFQWADEQGAIISNAEDLNQVYAGKYRVTVTDQNGVSTIGQAEIKSTKSSIYVQATVVDDPCEQSAGSITLQVTGGIPPYSCQWSYGNSNALSLTGLSAGSYSATITDALGCTQTGEFWISSSFQGLVVSETIVQPSCGAVPATGSITLSAFGLPPFTYSWSVPGETGPSLSSIGAGTYTVTVSNVQGCSVSKSFTVNHAETNSWTVLNNTFCDPAQGSGQIMLFVDGGNTLNWPLTTTWSNGIVHTLNGSPNVSVLDSVQTLPDGFYQVVATDAAGCRKAIGPIEVECEAQLAYAGHTCFQLRIGLEQAQPGETICVPVTADQFKAISRIETTMQWDTALLIFNQVVGHALTANTLTVTPKTGESIGIKWSAGFGNGLTLPDETTLFELCFTVKPDAPAVFTPLQFGPDYYGPGNFQIKSGKPLFLGILGFEGGVQIGGIVPERLHLEACATLPSCATDVLTNYTISAGNGTPPYTVQWYAGNQLQTGTLNDLLYVPAGTRYITITDQVGLSGAAALTQFAGYGPNTCVWPGDADDNNAVNQYDLLYLGYAFGSSGLSRIEPGSDWQGYWLGYSPGWSWDMVTPVRHIDFSNMDADGNGMVDEQDLDILKQHWGKVVRPGFHDPNLPPPIPNDVNSSSFQVFVQTDTTHVDSISIALQAGSSSAPATDINGLAFSIYYDTAVVQAQTLVFTPGASWLGSPDSTLLCIQKNFPGEGRLDLALSRKGISPESGFGALGTLSALLQDDMFRQNPNQPDSDTTITTHFRIGNLLALGASEMALASEGLETPVLIIRDILSQTTQAVSPSIPVYLSPNPATDLTRVRCPQARIEQIVVLNHLGEVVTAQNSVNSTFTDLDTHSLPAGFYWVGVQTNAGTGWSKLCVQH